jgi:hypothetical protein
MKRLEWICSRQGYRVLNVSYPSRKFCVEELSEDFLNNVIMTEIPPDTSKVHFITHSMGGIILRQYLSSHSLENLGAVVMLAPPNRGSEIVNLLKQNCIGRWILGPAGCQLGTEAADLPRRLGAVRYSVGVLAGSRSMNPFFSRILPGPDDGKVAVESTKVEGMKDFRTIPSSHTWIPWRETAIEQALAFIEKQRFICISTSHD